MSTAPGGALRAARDTHEHPKPAEAMRLGTPVLYRQITIWEVAIKVTALSAPPQLLGCVWTRALAALALKGKKNALRGSGVSRRPWGGFVADKDPGRLEGSLEAVHAWAQSSTPSATDERSLN